MLRGPREHHFIHRCNGTLPSAARPLGEKRCQFVCGSLSAETLWCLPALVSSVTLEQQLATRTQTLSVSVNSTAERNQPTHIRSRTLVAEPPLSRRGWACTCGVTDSLSTTRVCWPRPLHALIGQLDAGTGLTEELGVNRRQHLRHTGSETERNAKAEWSPHHTMPPRL
ncbi:hypothetical protein AOLI_G00250530 [Acnodon oligacanthus]